MEEGERDRKSNKSNNGTHSPWIFFMSFAKYVSVWFFVVFSLTFVLFTHAFHKCWYSRYVNLFFSLSFLDLLVLKNVSFIFSKLHSINNRFCWVFNMLEMNNKTFVIFFLKIICPFLPHNAHDNNNSSKENTNKWSWSFPDFIYHPKCICSHHMLW